jgi:hypothetical protein
MVGVTLSEGDVWLYSNFFGFKFDSYFFSYGFGVNKPSTCGRPCKCSRLEQKNLFCV